MPGRGFPVPMPEDSSRSAPGALLDRAGLPGFSP